MLRIFVKKPFLLMFFLVFWASRVWPQQTEDLTLHPKDRILVLAPHPDDEVLGTGGVIQRAMSMKLPLKTVFFTNGDSNQWSFLLYRKYPVIMPGAAQSMGLVRMKEALAASSILGMDPKDVIFLGYPDFGTLNIWYQHWHKRPAYTSILTRAKFNPYQDTFRKGASYKGEEILADLRAIIRDFQPTKIFVSHPVDHNGDHLSLYLYLRVALWDEQMDQRVEIYPYLVHYIGWPLPNGFKPDLALEPPEILSESIQWTKFQLTEQELELKKTALQAHTSQYKSTPKYLLSFIRRNELFGDFPAVKLHVNENSSVFKIGRKQIPVTELPEEFNYDEKLSFIGVEWKFVRWEGGDLIVSIELSKPLAKKVQATIYIFGYNPSVPFEKMPKISVRLGSFSYTVYDQAKRIQQSSIRVKRSSNEITLAVPLKLLGDPYRILTSARTYLGNVPLGSASWISVELD